MNVPENAARLLYSYQEPKRAYELLVRGTEGEDREAQLELFKARLLTEIGLYERADSALSRLSVGKGFKWDGLTDLWRARLHIFGGRYEDALRYLDKAAPALHPTFGPYRDLLLFEALVGSGRGEEALALGMVLFALTDTEPIILQFWENLLDAFIASDSLARAVELASTFKKYLLAPAGASRISAKEIDLLFQLGDTMQVRKKIHSLAKAYPKEPATINAVQKGLERFPLVLFASDELLLYCELLLNNNELQEGRKILTHLRKRRLNLTNSEKRKMLLADLYYREKKFSQAADLARQKYSDILLKRRSMLVLARCYRRMGREVSAAMIYENFTTAFPSDVKAAEALFVAAELYSRAKYITRSLRTLERLHGKYPSSYFGRIAALKLSWHYIQRGSMRKSAAILEKMSKHSRRRNEAALYYLSEVYGKMGKLEKQMKILNQLESLDSTSFYLHPFIDLSTTQPLLSSRGVVELMGEGGIITFLKDNYRRKAAAYQTIRDSLPEVREWGPYEKAQVRLERCKIFIDMGFKDWARNELEVAEKILKPSMRLTFELAIFCDQNGMTWKSMKLSQRVWDSIHGKKRRALAGAFSLLLHPLPFPVQVFENCARHGLAPHLVYAMIREESSFDLTAVSRAGAQGLMQLMPGTGRHIAQQLDLPENVGENLFTPEINLAFGIWYASYLLHRCGGDPLMMLAAYNAGITNARRWFPSNVKRYAVPRVVDGITFKETLNYVKRIVESAHVYRSLYFDTGALPRTSQVQRR